MIREDYKRKLAAILSADVEGYSRLMGDNEVLTIRTLTAHKEAMTSLIKQHHGRVVDAPGDNLLTEFASVVDAVNCAVEIQQTLAEHNQELPDKRKMHFRIGVNLGDVVVEEDRIYGDGVNIAARVENLCDGGGICISGTAFEHVENKLDLKFKDLGEHKVKNIVKPVRIYSVIMTSESRESVMDETLELPDKPSIAVLPFVNMSGDPNREYFSDGLTEQIITGISKIPNLFVIARNSTFVYKGKAIRVQQVAQELGAKYVLEGSVQMSEDRVRINAQLIDATTGHHLWAESYDRILKDIFAIQDGITIKLIEALNVKLSDGKLHHYGGGTKNINAFIKMLQGLEYLFRSTEEDNFHARKCWEDAINLDQNYASAYAWLAWTHIVDHEYGWSKSPIVSLEQAEKMALKTTSLDDSLDLGHRVLSRIYLDKRQHDKALEEGHKALALNPNNAENHVDLAWVFNLVGNPENAFPLFEKAFRLNPIAPAWYFQYLATSYGLTGQISEAIKAHKKAVHLTPDYIWPHVSIAAIYISTGNEKDARKAARAALKIDPKFSLNFVASYLPYKDQSILQKFIALLRKAGLK
jgi:adenylate cyclase